MGEHTALLQRGAMVAQNPAGFEQVSELEEHEREALRNEVLHKWRQPAALYVTVILCSVGAAVQGWDQTGSNGANLSWPVAFGVPDTGPNKTDWNVWIVCECPLPFHSSQTCWAAVLTRGNRWALSMLARTWLRQASDAGFQIPSINSSVAEELSSSLPSSVCFPSLAPP